MVLLPAEEKIKYNNGTRLVMFTGTSYRCSCSARTRFASCRFLASCIRFCRACFVCSCCWCIALRCSSGCRGCALEILGMVSSLFSLFDSSSVCTRTQVLSWSLSLPRLCFQVFGATSLSLPYRRLTPTRSLYRPSVIFCRTNRTERGPPLSPYLVDRYCQLIGGLAQRWLSVS